MRRSQLATDKEEEEEEEEEEEQQSLLTFAGMFLSRGRLKREESVREGSLNSCIIQSVLMPLAALPL